MAEDFKMLLKFVVSGVFILAFIRESKCCLSTDPSTRIIMAHPYTSLFINCPCKGDKEKLEYLKWAGPDNKTVSESGPDTDTHIHVERADDGLNLLIKNFTAEMAGKYLCSAFYDHKYMINIYQLQLYPLLQFVNTDQKQYLIKGQDSKISCKTNSDVESTPLWHRQSKEYAQISDNEKYKIDNNGLLINNVQASDAGVYQCSYVVLDTGDKNDINITVDVISIPDIIDLEVTPNKTVVAGDFLKIECKGTGEPSPNYNWTKIIDGKPTPLPQEDGNYTSWYQENDTLTFETITPEDRGTYRCTVFNMAGVVTKEVTIEVLEPPQIIEFNNVTAIEGSSTKITCRVRARPLPRVNLLFEKTGVDVDTRVSQSTDRKSDTELSFALIFSQVSRLHHGLYTCEAVNDVDNVSENALLNVLFKPVFEKVEEVVWGWKGQTINLTCSYECNPEGIVMWRYHNEDNVFKSTQKFSHEPVAQVVLGEIPLYGTYTCTVKNEIGMSTRTIYLKEAHPPGPLMNVVPKSKTATSVVFDIVGPTDAEGPPILAYTTEYDEADKYNTTHIHYNRTWDVYRPYKVENLKLNTTYFFRFAAINQVGTGNWSSLLELTTEPKSAPEEPLWEDNIPDEYDNVHNIILSWKMPESNGEPIDYYVVKYCENEEDDDIPYQCYRDTTYENKIMLQNLKPNTTYHIMLSAHNSIGNSPVAEKFIKTADTASNQSLSASNIIGISVLLVVVCLVLVDLLLCCLKDQGVIANVCCRKRKQRQNAKEKALAVRDKKGLLSDGESPTNAARPENNGHKEFVYQKNTGIVSGKHSAV